MKNLTLCPPCCAATVLDISVSALLKGIGGTDTLTRIPKGDGTQRTKVLFVLEEVLQLKARKIDAARSMNRKVLRLAR